MMADPAPSNVPGAERRGSSQRSSGTQVVFRSIAQNLQKAIEAGVYDAGDRMPSVRMMADQWGVSLSTAAHAYRELELLGLLRAEARRGYYVTQTSTSEASTSGEMRVSDASREMVQLQHGGDDGVDEWTSDELHPSMRPQTLIAHALREIMRQPPQDAGFADPSGHAALRLQVSRHIRLGGSHIEADHLMLVNGSLSCFDLLFQTALTPGQEIAVQAPVPSWVLRLLEQHQLLVHELPSDPDKGVSIEVLDYLFDSRPISAVLMWPNGSPIHGAGCDQESYDHIMAQCAQRGVWLFTCDDMGDLMFDQGKRVRFAMESDRMVVMSSLSAQWGPLAPLTWVAGGSIHHQLIEHSLVRSGSNRQLLEALAIHMTADDAWVSHQKRLRTQLRRAHERFSQEVLPIMGTCQTSIPLSGMMRWVTFSEQLAEVIHDRASEAGIRLFRGTLCSTSNRYRTGYRFNVSGIDPEAWLQRLTPLFTE